MSYLSDIDIFKVLSQSPDPVEFSALCDALYVGDNQTVRNNFLKRLNKLVNSGSLTLNGSLKNGKYVYYFGLSSGAANALQANEFILKRVDIADKSSRRAFIVSLFSLGVSAFAAIMSFIALLR